MSGEKELHKIRQDYSLKELTRSDLDDNPIELFRKWIDEAIELDVEEPTAMNLSTVDACGQPSSRIVLLKEITDKSICFFTNYNSRKAKQLEVNNRAAITFFWPAIERQVRIEGVVLKSDSVVSDAYFKSRPYESRLGAWASPQSQIIENREVLLAVYEKTKERFADAEEVNRPTHWCVYQFLPHLFEFWQGRPGRLHDRFQYKLEKEKWGIDRLAP